MDYVFSSCSLKNIFFNSEYVLQCKILSLERLEKTIFIFGRCKLKKTSGINMTYNTPLIGIRDDLSFYPDMFALAIVDVATIASVGYVYCCFFCFVPFNLFL